MSFYVSRYFIACLVLFIMFVKELVMFVYIPVEEILKRLGRKIIHKSMSIVLLDTWPYLSLIVTEKDYV